MNEAAFKNLCKGEQKDIRNYIINLSHDDTIELRAKLNAKIVNKDKYNFLIFEASFLAAWLSLIIGFGGLLSEEEKILFFGENIYLYILRIMLACTVIFGLVTVACCLILYNKSQYVKALSFLDDYSKEQQIVDNFHIQSEECIETFEQTKRRHKREIEQLITRWKSKQEFVNKQIELYEATLNEKN